MPYLHEEQDPSIISGGQSYNMSAVKNIDDLSSSDEDEDGVDDDDDDVDDDCDNDD